jgi:hypothetical protein
LKEIEEIENVDTLLWRPGDQLDKIEARTEALRGLDVDAAGKANGCKVGTIAG